MTNIAVLPWVLRDVHADDTFQFPASMQEAPNLQGCIQQVL